MENNKKRIKWRINFFDIAIIVVVLAAAFIVLKVTGSGSSSIASSETTVRYTVAFSTQPEGVSGLISVGDALKDNTKNYSIGSVVSVTAQPALRQTVNTATGETLWSEIPGHEDITLVIETGAVETATALTAGGGFIVRTGAAASVAGPGYAASGYIVAIERG